MVYKPDFIPLGRCHTKPIAIPTTPMSSLSIEHRLDYMKKQESEDMTKQLPAELEVLRFRVGA